MGEAKLGEGSVAPNAVLLSVLYRTFRQFTIKIPQTTNKLAIAFQ